MVYFVFRNFGRCLILNMILSLDLYMLSFVDILTDFPSSVSIHLNSVTFYE